MQYERKGKKPETRDDSRPTFRSALFRVQAVTAFSVRSFSRSHANESSTAAAVFKLHVTGHQRKQRVVLALTDVFTSLMLRAALANQYRTRIHQLASEALYAQSLAVRIAAVC